MTRKELTADIKNRVAAGESKRAIFSRYSMTEWEDAASRILPLQVTLAKRKRWRFLNWALVGCFSVITLFNPTFHVRNESPRFARTFVRFLELSNKGLHYTPADAVCAASELTFGGGCAGSVSPSWFKRVLTSSFGST